MVPILVSYVVEDQQTLHVFVRSAWIETDTSRYLNDCLGPSVFLRSNLSRWIEKMVYSCKPITQSVMIWCSEIHVSSLILNKV
jgi:hypothetical protein